MACLPERALPDPFGAFVALRQGPGLAIFLAQVVRPRAIEAEAGIAGAVVLKKGELSRIQKELILLSLAAVDANVYCITAHWEFLRRLGLGDDQIRRTPTDHHRAGLSPPDVALLDFAIGSGASPRPSTTHDVETMGRVYRQPKHWSGTCVRRIEPGSSGSLRE